jgi:protocatechuate 3,4-dioxygenase beta subunit
MAQRTREEAAGYRREDDPPYLHPDCVATRLRAPKKPLFILPRTLSDTTGPAYGRSPKRELDDDLTSQHTGEPVGERIIVTGHVLDGRPVRSSLVEIWRANASGRYTHEGDGTLLRSTRTSRGGEMPHGRRGPVQLRDGKAWGLSLEEP